MTHSLNLDGFIEERNQILTCLAVHAGLIL